MTSMRRIMPGLHDGERVRAERRPDGLWFTEVRVRDCGALLGIETMYYEGHDQGTWHGLGSYRTLASAQRACDALFAGTHVLRPAHENSTGRVPARLVPFVEAQDEILDATSTGPRL